MLKQIPIVALLSMSVSSSITTIVLASSNDSSDDNSNKGWIDSCYDAGYEDGLNGPFSRPTYDHCGDEAGGDDAYYNGFIDG